MLTMGHKCKMKSLLFLLAMLAGSTGELHSQTKTVTGKVVDNDLKPIGFVFIYMYDTLQIGKTGQDGVFSIDVPRTVSKLSFSTVGMESAHVTLEDTCLEVELVMQLACTCDFMTMDEVERYRMKQFKKLPHLHQQAFEQGIFKSNKPSYIREFIPFFKK